VLRRGSCHTHIRRLQHRNDLLQRCVLSEFLLLCHLRVFRAGDKNSGVWERKKLGAMQTDALCAALVRGYLERRGLQRVLEVFDTEMATEARMSRKDVAIALRIGSLVKRNAQRGEHQPKPQALKAFVSH
jgi:hypothetical protein